MCSYLEANKSGCWRILRRYRQASRPWLAGRVQSKRHGTCLLFAIIFLYIRSDRDEDTSSVGGLVYSVTEDAEPLCDLFILGFVFSTDVLPSEYNSKF